SSPQPCPTQGCDVGTFELALPQVEVAGHRLLVQQFAVAPCGPDDVHADRDREGADPQQDQGGRHSLVSSPDRSSGMGMYSSSTFSRNRLRRALGISNVSPVASCSRTSGPYGQQSRSEWNASPNWP